MTAKRNPQSSDNEKSHSQLKKLRSGDVLFVQQHTTMLTTNNKDRSIPVYVNHNNILLSFRGPPPVSMLLHICLPPLADSHARKDKRPPLSAASRHRAPLALSPLSHRFLITFPPLFRQMHRPNSSALLQPQCFSESQSVSKAKSPCLRLSD